MFEKETLASFFPPGGLRAAVLSEEERDAILCIAYLAIAADRQLQPEEVATFFSVAALLGSSAAGPDDLVAATRRAVKDPASREEADDELRRAAARIPRIEARRIAYQAAYLLSVSDLATSDQEFEFDLQLIDALDLDQDDADALVESAMKGLGVDD